MFKHPGVLIALTWFAAALPDAFGQVASQRRLSSRAGPVEVHVPERLIPRQPPRTDDWPMRGLQLTVREAARNLGHRRGDS